MDMSKSALLHDLWSTYDLQMKAMKKAAEDGNNITASLHFRMAEQLLETYFDVIDKVIVE